MGGLNGVIQKFISLFSSKEEKDLTQESITNIYLVPSQNDNNKNNSFKFYHQNNPSWAKEKMASDCFGKSGCFVTCLTNIINIEGLKVNEKSNPTPKDVNDFIKQNNLYLSNSFLKTNEFCNKMNFEIKELNITKKDNTIQMIKENINNHHIIIKFKKIDGSTHFVNVVSVEKDEILIWDPIDSKYTLEGIVKSKYVTKTYNDYIKQGWEVNQLRLVYKKNKEIKVQKEEIKMNNNMLSLVNFASSIVSNMKNNNNINNSILYYQNQSKYQNHYQYESNYQNEFINQNKPIYQNEVISNNTSQINSNNDCQNISNQYENSNNQSNSNLLNNVNYDQIFYHHYNDNYSEDNYYEKTNTNNCNYGNSP